MNAAFAAVRALRGLNPQECPHRYFINEDVDIPKAGHQSSGQPGARAPAAKDIDAPAQSLPILFPEAGREVWRKAPGQFEIACELPVARIHADELLQRLDSGTIVAGG